MQTRPIRRVAAAATSALVLWQCGGDDSGTPGAIGSSRRVDACELVPRQEVQQIVGAEVVDASGNFSEHGYTKPVSYTASCMYTGERVVMLGVNYPVPQSRRTSEELASSISAHLRSSAEAENDPSLAKLYQATEVRPVAGLAGPAAEYAMLEQVTLEVQAGPYRLKIMAPSLESARDVAARAITRLQ